MPMASRKAQELSVAVRSPGPGSDDVMTAPLHPMHQLLLARMSAPPIAADALARPTRMAIAFYGSIAAWGAVWLMFEAVGTAL